MPLISVCIPAYNRASLLRPLLDSILNQDADCYEILICEDASPERDAIRGVAQEYSVRSGGRIRYIENARNMGYDGNLRELVAQAQGDYCLFMGNDDLMCAGALSAVATALNSYPEVGVLLRSYADFAGTPDNVVQEYRYFPDKRFFPAGKDAIVTAFRRSVVISGMVVHRASAQSFASGRFDGTLLYQLWLVGNILAVKNAVSLPEILVLRRRGIPPDFGQAEAEKGRFVPQDQTPDSSLHFMRGMLDIAAKVEHQWGAGVYRRIVVDIANYSYPILSIQADRPLSMFVPYWWRLARMGFGRYPIFHGYFLLLITLGKRRVDGLIGSMKRRLGHTPSLGGIFQGRSA